MRFEKLTQTIAAGGAWRLGMAAAELQIVASSYPLRVTLYRGGTVIGSGSNVLAGDYFRGVDFDAVELFSVDAQEVSILLSDGVSGSNRIVGEVSVINGEIARSLAGVAFSAAGGIGGAAGLYPNCQLWNPLGSGRRIVLSSVMINPGTTGAIVVRSDTVARTATVLAGASKLIGGAASVAEFRTENTAAISGSSLFELYATANDAKVVDFREPVILMPGYGIHLVNVTVNTTLSAMFQYYEDAIS